ncbi:hypothetical protein PG995_006734 [Apiospora arundinis]
MASGFALMQESGRELLSSGLFSDIKVIVGDKVWRAHKSILCTRSEYFKKAFTGQFKESQTGELEIHDQTPEDVHQILEYLYTCQLNSHESTLAQLLELHKVADYFSVDSLQYDIIAELYKRLQDQAHMIWEGQGRKSSKARRHRSEHWSDDELNQFFAAAKLVYTEPQFFGFWHKTIIRFLKMTYVIIGRDRRFTKALAGVPELAVDMVELIMDTKRQGERSMVAIRKPSACTKCHKKPDAPYGQTGVYESPGGLSIRGWCQSCDDGDD